jgi:hypothetical protein
MLLLIFSKPPFATCPARLEYPTWAMPVLRAKDLERDISKKTYVKVSLGSKILLLYLKNYTVPKTMQMSKSIGEKVLWRENFPIIRGNDA